MHTPEEGPSLQMYKSWLHIIYHSHRRPGVHSWAEMMATPGATAATFLCGLKLHLQHRATGQDMYSFDEAGGTSPLGYLNFDWHFSMEGKNSRSYDILSQGNSLSRLFSLCTSGQLITACCGCWAHL